MGTLNLPLSICRPGRREATLKMPPARLRPQPRLLDLELSARNYDGTAPCMHAVKPSCQNLCVICCTFLVFL